MSSYKFLLFLLVLRIVECQKLFQCFLNHPKQAESLIKLEKISSIDIWEHHPLIPNTSFRVIVNSDQEERKLKQIVKCTRLWLNTSSANIFLETLNTKEKDFFKNYHGYDDFIDKMREWEDSYPDFLTVSSIGKSVEDRDLIMMNITDKRYHGPKKVIWWNGGQHAREWISPAVVMYLANRLLEHSEENVLEFLKKVFYPIDNIQAEFVLTPLQNPDGYEYSRTRNRYWRKNRRANQDGSFGVDLNRNWDEHWGEYGSSSHGWSETYSGAYPFSEPETNYLAKWIQSIPNRLAGVDFHSYGQLILRNWGWTMKKSQNEEILKELGNGMQSIIYKTSKTVYKSEISAGLYPASGCTDDWMSSKMNMTGFTIELRDLKGFDMDASKIIPTGEEIWEAMKYFVDFVLTRNIPPNN